MLVLFSVCCSITRSDDILIFSGKSEEITIVEDALRMLFWWLFWLHSKSNDVQDCNEVRFILLILFIDVLKFNSSTTITVNFWISFIGLLKAVLKMHLLNC